MGLKTNILETTSYLRSEGSMYINSRHFRNIFYWYTTSSSPLSVHFKSSWTTSVNLMYRFIVEGYTYGQAGNIFSDAVGFYNEVANDIAQGAIKGYDTAGGTLTQYKSSDGYLTLKVTAASSFYFIGISISLQCFNPIDFSPSMSEIPTFTAYHQTNNI